MSDFKLDGDGDLDITGGGALITGAAEVVQRLDVVLSSYQGDYALDQFMGKDRTLFEATPPDERLIEHHIKALITGVDGVTRLVSYNQDVSGRVLNITFEASTDTGDTISGALETDPQGSIAGVLLNLLNLHG